MLALLQMFSSKPPAVCLSVKLCVSLHVVMWKCGVSTYRWGTGSGFPHNLSIRDRSTENCWVLLMSSCVSFCQPSSSHHHHHHHHHRHDHQQAGESQSIQTQLQSISGFCLIYIMKQVAGYFISNIYVYIHVQRDRFMTALVYWGTEARWRRC